MKSLHFDYIIIGNGLAGLQLALKLASDPYFKDKQIALIDSSTKSSNDKTWSFWETQTSHWDHLIHKSWNKASVITSKKRIDLTLNPYTYKSIRAIDFYNDSINKLKRHDNVSFIIEHVESVREDNLVKLTTEKQTYTATHVFDSRVPKEFTNSQEDYISIIQHFKGWIIKTPEDTFDEQTLTMMDYRLKDGEQTTFTYVLPFSKTEALVEFTYFNAYLVEEQVYDDFIKQYIKDYLKLDNYKIIETETGQIPMTNFPFEKFNTNKVTKIGTAGGWVKGSTGYSFKHTEKKVNQMITNIKANKAPSYNLFKRKYKFYDKLYLKVIKE